MGYYNNLDWVDAPGYEVPFGEAPPVISFNMVTPDYFRTMHIPLLEGRVFYSRRPRGCSVGSRGQ